MPDKSCAWSRAASGFPPTVPADDLPTEPVGGEEEAAPRQTTFAVDVSRVAAQGRARSSHLVAYSAPT